MYRIVAASLALALAACGNPAEKLADRAAEKAAGAMVSAASGGKARVEGDQVVVQDERGRIAVATGQAGLPRPAWWPQDVFLPEDARIHQVAQNEGNNVLAAMFDASGAALGDRIEQGMAAQGWETRRNSRSADGAGMAAFAKDGREVTVLVMPTRRAEAGVMATYHLRQPRRK